MAIIHAYIKYPFCQISICQLVSNNMLLRFENLIKYTLSAYLKYI